MRELRPFTVITPEHVPIELVPAGMGRRILAAALDVGLCIGMISLLSRLLGFAPVAVGILVKTTGAFLIAWGYHVWCEVRFGGQSMGKKLLQLRVCDARGLPVTLHQSMARNAARAVDMLPVAGIGLLSCLLDPWRRRIGDQIADTLVVNEVQPSQKAEQRLERVTSNSLDIPRLRRALANHLSLEEREFLLSLCLRAPGLQETARYDLFESVGEHYRSRFGISDEHLSGEKLVRNLLALCYRRDRK